MRRAARSASWRCRATPRVPQLPDVPTVAELGYPGYKAVTWNGLMAPAGTPQADRRQDRSRDRHAPARTRSSSSGWRSFGADPSGITPAEFAELIAADLKLWAEAVAIAGVKQQ